MIISFRHNIEQSPSFLTAEGINLERTESYKLLGLTIQNNMKWDLHIEEIVTKASKRIHILRVLNRCGVLPSHLLRVYFVLIRPLLEYCCQVWHSSQSINLSVQKRSVRIMYPELSYDAVLDQRARRDLMCTRTFGKIRQPVSRINHVIPPSRETGHNCNLRNGDS